MIVDGVIAIIIAYLLGSIPSAYIITRFRTGKDIRKLGGGNVGARNVLHEVGLWEAIVVGVFDAAKGAAAVATASLLLDPPLLFVLLAGLAVVAGHIWSVFLKFSGGNGLATTIGVLSFLMTRELLIAVSLALLLIVFTRNPILSANIGLLSVPLSALFLREFSLWLYLAFSVGLVLMMALNFLPTARAALVKAGSRENLLAELLRRNKA
jgi:glycerol-3-phosphate acyltransferase PlsY